MGGLSVIKAEDHHFGAPRFQRDSRKFRLNGFCHEHVFHQKRLHVTTVCISVKDPCLRSSSRTTRA
jgi:hypothetical protein